MSCICGDATSETAWQQALGPASADLLFTDPPYCLLTRRRRGGDERDPKHRKNESGEVVQRFENVRAYREFTERWMKLAAARVKGPFVVWTNLLGREPILTTAAKHGWKHLRGEFVWGKKTRDGNSGEELLRVVEVALVLTRDSAVPPTPDDAAVPWSAVAGYDDDGEAALFGSHPNHKPFGVLEPLVRTWSRKGQLVVDPFAGSGSLPAAAQKLGRAVACIELQPKWAERVSQRLAKI